MTSYGTSVKAYSANLSQSTFVKFRIAPHDPLAVHSMCALEHCRSTHIYIIICIHSPGVVNRKQTKWL